MNNKRHVIMCIMPSQFNIKNQFIYFLCWCWHFEYLTIYCKRICSL